MPAETSSSLAGLNARLDAILGGFEYIHEQRQKLRSILEYQQQGNEVADYIINGISEKIYSLTFDETVIIRGLIVDTAAAFEQYFKFLVNAIVQWRESSVDLFSEFDDSFKNQYVKAAASVLRHYGSGTVNGVKYDFDSLTTTFAGCLKNETPFVLDGTVFTISSGNPTSERITDVFRRLGLDCPFKPPLGQKFLDEFAIDATSSTAAAEIAAERLDRYLNERNDIIHGLSQPSPTQDNLIDFVLFFQTLGSALSAIVAQETVN